MPLSSIKESISKTQGTSLTGMHRLIRRRLTTKRFSASEMLRFARYLTNGKANIGQITAWFDGPAGDRGHTEWV